MASKCTVCGTPVQGHPDDDVCCAWCDKLNLAGDPLRYPPRQQRTPVPWWERERLELAPLNARQRLIDERIAAYIQGPWIWTPEGGAEERS